MIMDGNKRWANINKVSLKKGYQQGLNKLREIVLVCLEQEIKHLTVYALSNQNIKRVSVSKIFDIIINQSREIIEEFGLNNDVKVKIIGEFNNALHAPIQYWATIVKTNENNLAKNFINYLKSDNAKKIYTKHGFTNLEIEK